MTEKNITEKLGESISNLIKKTNTFEKVESILKGISVFMFLTLCCWCFYRNNIFFNNYSKKIIF